MASIYKRKQDKGKRRPAWYICYKDENGRKRTKKGFTDKKETELLAAKLELEAMRRREGLIDPEEERRANRRKAPLQEHLMVFEKSLKASEEHVKRTMSRVRRIINDAEMKLPADIDIESVEAVLSAMLNDEEIGHKTYNHYVDAVRQFCRWMVPNRIPVNPLEGIKKLNTEVDVRHQRRALSIEHFRMLLKSARSSGVDVQCYSGEQRARIYTISYMTGLRRTEIASLTPRSFRLDDNPPTVTVDAACSKHRRKDVLPLHEALVVLLRDWLANIEPDQPIFPRLGKRRTWLMVKKDLERTDIPYKNAEGIADFHAAGRHTYITGLLKNGASIVEAKELARHSDVKMTMKYTHIGIDDQHRALQKLPWEDTGSKPKPTDSLNMSSGDTTKANPTNDETPVTDRGCRSNSSSVGGCLKWRIGDSNP